MDTRANDLFFRTNRLEYNYLRGFWVIHYDYGTYARLVGISDIRSRNQTIGTRYRAYGVGAIDDADNFINIILSTPWYNQRIRFTTIVDKLRLNNLGR